MPLDLSKFAGPQGQLATRAAVRKGGGAPPSAQPAQTGVAERVREQASAGGSGENSESATAATVRPPGGDVAAAGLRGNYVIAEAPARGTQCESVRLCRDQAEAGSTQAWA